MILGIDASTGGSGGAKRHLIELLTRFDPNRHYFEKIKIWGNRKLLDELPGSDVIEKISHPYLDSGLIKRIFWQLILRDKLFMKEGVDILFSPFGIYSGSIRPYVSMSRNMLAFEKKERARFGISWLRLKFKLLYYRQKQSFKNAQGIIFLSRYAKNKISQEIHFNSLNYEVIPHGVSDVFNCAPKEQIDIRNYSFERPYKFLYVSTVWAYKHPTNIVRAIYNLRNKGYPIILTLIGDEGQRNVARSLDRVISSLDPERRFIIWHKAVGLNQVAKYYKAADAFIFASTCENMPNILIEAMSSGLPIFCSSYGPMPEFLIDGGLYFDPTDVSDVEVELEKMILNQKIRNEKSQISYLYSQRYSWDDCAAETFSFLERVANKMGS